MRFKKWNETLERYNATSMADVLVPLYDKYGSHEAVAQELGLTVKGLREWRRKAHCQPVTRLRCEELAIEQSALAVSHDR